MNAIKALELKLVEYSKENGIIAEHESSNNNRCNSCSGSCFGMCAVGCGGACSGACIGHSRGSMMPRSGDISYS